MSKKALETFEHFTKQAGFDEVELRRYLQANGYEPEYMLNRDGKSYGVRVIIDGVTLEGHVEQCGNVKRWAVSLY
ncbi:hypothetical protein KAR91_22940 [Candidatus Pacearchaeota archaeon]|nr:hypothetical protein [Candidatus Pacearchaeota archaeon]